MVWSRKLVSKLPLLGLLVVLGLPQKPAFSQLAAIPDMPHPRIGMSYARIGQMVYFIGGATQHAQNLQGFDAYDGTNIVDAFNFQTMSWDTTVAPLNTPRVFACSATIHDSIYVMGGADDSGNVVGSVEVYDPVSNSWHYRSSMLHPRKGAAAEVVDDKILVFGGAGVLGLRKDVEEYSVADDQWSETYEMRFGHAYHKVFMAHEHIYIFGGISDVTSIINPYGLIEKYDPEEGASQVSVVLHTPRMLFGIAAKGDSVFVISGLGVASAESHIELLDLHNEGEETDTELDSTLIDAPRVGFIAAVGRDGRIYLFGGVSPIFKSGQVPVATVSVISGLNVNYAAAVKQAVPSTFNLMQNYPNPFNPSTIIGYDVPPDGARVSIEVFNMLGQRVATVVDGFESGGRHYASFNGVNIPSGSYIYRMKSENGITYRKMVLIR
ncbi:MAG TPA: kelch repeat-containing protein [Candidatus Kryptonia bacterium]